MMRRFFLFLMIFLISIMPLVAATHDTTKTGTAQINTKLTAGTAKGTFVGFSSTSHETTSGGSGLTPITSLNLTLDHQTPTSEIESLPASGSFYAYWIVRNNTSAMKISLSWIVPDGITITVSKNTTITSPSNLVTVKASSSSTTVGSQLISIVTENLLDKIYGATYTIVFTITAEAQS